MYKLAGPLTTPAILQIPVYSKALAVETKTYTPGDTIFISFRSFGGTEMVTDNLMSVVNTAVVETWYRPDIKSDCRLVVDGKNYEILGEPENIQMRNQYLKFKVREIRGGA